MERQDNLKIDDVVLLADENYPRGQWPLVRVVEVMKGNDGMECQDKDVFDCSDPCETEASRRSEDNNCYVGMPNHEAVSSGDGQHLN